MSQTSLSIFSSALVLKDDQSTYNRSQDHPQIMGLIRQTIVYSFLVTAALGQLVYQESDTNDNRRPQSHDRVPVHSSKCAEGELLYPGDNPGNWACDCKPTYVYYPATSKCYQIFSQGPCRTNEILELPKSKRIPVCKSNTCEVGKVMFQNVCAKLESQDSCQIKAQRLYINPTNLELFCALRIPSRFNDDEDGVNFENNCFVGGKRSQEGLC